MLGHNTSQLANPQAESAAVMTDVTSEGGVRRHSDGQEIADTGEQSVAAPKVESSNLENKTRLLRSQVDRLQRKIKRVEGQRHRTAKQSLRLQRQIHCCYNDMAHQNARQKRSLDMNDWFLRKLGEICDEKNRLECANSCVESRNTSLCQRIQDVSDKNVRLIMDMEDLQLDKDLLIHRVKALLMERHIALLKNKRAILRNPARRFILARRTAHLRHIRNRKGASPNSSTMAMSSNSEFAAAASPKSQMQKKECSAMTIGSSTTLMETIFRRFQ